MRPRTQKKSKAKDRLLEDRPTRSQGQECSRPRTQGASVLRKKNGPKIFFSGDLQKIKKKVFGQGDANFLRKISRSPTKNRSLQIFRKVSADFQGKVKSRSWPCPIFNESKKVLSSSRRQDIFEDLSALSQSQGLQNVYSRTPPLTPFTNVFLFGNTSTPPSDYLCVCFCFDRQSSDKLLVSQVSGLRFKLRAGKIRSTS